MIISIASGKGGTGKTTLTTNLAYSLCDSNKVLLLDCDVEEPNAHLFVGLNKIFEKKDVNTLVPVIDKTKCKMCNKCIEVCEFNVFCNIKYEILIFKELCHSCGACAYFCPTKAITETSQKIGTTSFCNINDNLDFVYGCLDISQPMAPPVIAKVKEYIKSPKKYDYYIIDSPPGTACSMVNTVNKSDFCILVTEPTPFGLNDLKLAVDVVKELKVPFGVVINKAELGDKKVNQYCDSLNIPILQEFAFDKKLAKTYSKGNLIINDFPEYKNKFLKIVEQINKV